MGNLLQIRTGAKSTLQDVVEELVMRGWGRVENQFRSAWYAPGTYAQFYRAIHKAIEPYVKSYDICGGFPECSDEVEGAPWLDRHDHIYLLDIPFSFERFIEQVAFAGFTAIKDLLEYDSVSRAFDDMKLAFRGTFGAQIYSNPVCKKTGICSLAREISPWTDELVYPGEAAKV